VHCFGDRELTVEGSVVTGFGGVEPGTFEPEWLAHPHAAAGAISNGRQGFFFHQPPDAEREQLAEGQRVRVTGHFDDPAAATCAMATGVEGTPEPDAIAVLYCRERFVASAVEVIAP
jgi:hypothetical protein